MEKEAKAYCRPQGDCDQPCRENSVTMLRRRAREFHDRACALDQLADALSRANLPDDADQALFDMACKCRPF